jgi:tRNA(Glu) U13 pseudouridine synthase TruD
VTADRVKAGVTKLKHFRSVYVGNFCYKDTGLELGDLGGNHFNIGLRNISPEARYAGFAKSNPWASNVGPECEICPLG